MRPRRGKDRTREGRDASERLTLEALGALLMAALGAGLLHAPWHGVGALLALGAGTGLVAHEVTQHESALRVLAEGDEAFRVRLGLLLLLLEAGLVLVVLHSAYPWATGAPGVGWLGPVTAGLGVLVWGCLRLLMRGAGLSSLGLALGWNDWSPVELVSLEDAPTRRKSSLEVVDLGDLAADSSPLEWPEAEEDPEEPR